jgi:hypothetical protein
MYPDSKSLRDSSRILGSWEYEIFVLPGNLEIKQGHLVGLIFNVLNLAIVKVAAGKITTRTRESDHHAGSRIGGELPTL